MKGVSRENHLKDDLIPTFVIYIYFFSSLKNGFLNQHYFFGVKFCTVVILLYYFFEKIVIFHFNIPFLEKRKRKKRAKRGEIL
jgi:hypothetical protein